MCKVTPPVAVLAKRTIHHVLTAGWSNLGQGAPEVGEIPGTMTKPDTIDVSEHLREYGSTAGIRPLREAVADLYNAHYRKGQESQYS